MTQETMTIEFNLGNAAFDGETERSYEINRILKDIACKVSNGQSSGPVHDINGSKIGSWAYDPYENEEED